jgi:hypothetical protein
LLLVPNRQSIAVPIQKFEPIAAPTAKHEQIASQRILAELLLDQPHQRIEALAQSSVVSLTNVGVSAEFFSGIGSSSRPRLRSTRRQEKKLASLT